MKFRLKHYPTESCYVPQYKFFGFWINISFWNESSHSTIWLIFWDDLNLDEGKELLKKWSNDTSIFKQWKKEQSRQAVSYYEMKFSNPKYIYF